MAEILRLAPVTGFEWAEEDAAGKDFIHIVYLAVEPAKQGSGLFRKLIEPFMVYADDNDLAIYLETYQDDLEEMYKHFGFETIERIESSDTPLAQRCMKRKPE